MIRFKDLVKVFLMSKIFLDVFSPLREINILIELFFLILIIVQSRGSFVSSGSNFLLFLTIIFIHGILFSLNLDGFRFYICFLFLIGGFLVPSNFSFIELSKLLFAVSKFGLSCLIINLVYSNLIGIYSNRMVWNFEHVNLFGTYIVFLAFLFILSIELNERFISNSKILFFKITYVLIGLFSTSTGAFLILLMIFIPYRYFYLKNLLYFTLYSIIGLSMIFFVSKFYFPDFFHKVFGVYDVFQVYTFEEFYDYSIRQDSKSLTEAMELGGSLTWRINTYLFFLFNAFNAPVLNILIGSGVSSYLDFAYFMPHNDFIAILLDFGIIGLTLLFLLIWSLYKKSIVLGFKSGVLFLVFFVLRLGFENCIYSTYVFSLILFAFGVVLFLVNRRNEFYAR